MENRNLFESGRRRIGRTDCAVKDIGGHIHAGKMELHEVMAGAGRCAIGEETVDCAPGTIAYIPDDIHHRVMAGDGGLELLAKFSPALI